MKELDPADLVRELNDQSDLPGYKQNSPVGGSKTDLPTIAGRGCWCGQENGHDWPGKAAGGPHPRDGWVERDGVDRLETTD